MSQAILQDPKLPIGMAGDAEKTIPAPQKIVRFSGDPACDTLIVQQSGRATERQLWERGSRRLQPAWRRLPACEWWKYKKRLQQAGSLFYKLAATSFSTMVSHCRTIALWLGFEASPAIRARGEDKLHPVNPDKNAFLSANLGQDKITGLYIHIPFCARKCPYCDFYSLEGRSSGLIDDYISALIKEMGLYHEQMNHIKTVYIGGGTPSILNIAQLTVLLEGIYRYIKGSGLMEFTVEVNPKSITGEKLRLFKDYGITRISLGIQSFNERDLKILGRLHSVDDSLKAVDDIKRLFFNLSVDLIYGIPEQTLKDWQENLSIIEDLDPDHISTYELTVEEGTPLHQEISRGLLKKPDEKEIVDIYEKTHNYLEKKGYIHYEVSNFAKTDRLCLHNLNYWKRGEYIGIGAGAHSFINKKRIENYKDLRIYQNSLKEGRFPYKKIVELSPEDEFVEFIMLGLRLKEGISLDRIPGETSFKERVLKRCLPLIERGLLKKEDNFLKPTLKGFLLLNEVITALI